jgi:hypothetical protein
MQDDDVEVAFCDLCGTSVPAGDLDAGTAVRHQGKTVGACCLPALRGADRPAVALAGVGSPLPRPAVTASDARVLPVAIVLLAAIAAATLFLDHRITNADTFQRQSLGQVAEAQTSDSQVLASLAVAMDTVPRRAEIDALAQKVDALATAAGALPAEVQKRLDAVATEVGSLARELRTHAEKAVDYRPLLDDLRDRQVRLLDVVTAMRAIAPPAADAASNPSAAPAPAAEPEVPALPAALAEHVKKLTATDPALRFEAVDELVRSKDVLVLPHLVPLARDADVFVRRLTIEGLGDFKRPEAVDALLGALADANDLVRDTAWRSLTKITGQKIAFDANGTKDARARAIQRWQEWWDKNKATFGS